jgi:hypothetical protein
LAPTAQKVLHLAILARSPVRLARSSKSLARSNKSLARTNKPGMSVEATKNKNREIRSTRVDPPMDELSVRRVRANNPSEGAEYITESECLRQFGWKDFDLARVDKKSHQCPLRGCSEKLLGVPYRNKTLPWCPAHAIRLHSDTFVYWNGPDSHAEDARLRNFIVRPDLASAIALPNGKKAEAHRLGFEMSEDALSWNVFVSLAEAGKLREAIHFLTGRKVRSTPHLYLWGLRIDDPAGELYEPLRRVRAKLEPDIHTFATEPDIMLVAEKELVVCIEAKFGSGNPLAYDSAPKKGQKPTSRKGLLDRYLGEGTSDRTRRIVCAEKIGPAPRSQLFRNVVFACEMAETTPWHVVNLVRGTKTRRRSENRRTSYTDPTDEVRSYLHPDWRYCFTFQTWEKLHAEVISGDPDLAHLDRYLRDKSAHFEPAFELN